MILEKLQTGLELLLFREAAIKLAAFHEFTHVCTQSFYVLATFSNNGTGILSREAFRFL